MTIQAALCAATGHRDTAGAHHLDHAKGAQQLDQAVHAIFGADGLNDQRVQRDVHDLGAVDVHDLHHLGARLGVGAHLDQRQLTHNCRLVGDILDTRYVNLLFQLLDGLIDHALVAGDDESHAADALGLAVTHRQALNIEAAPAKQARHPGQHTGPVFHPCYYCMFHKFLFCLETGDR